MIDTAKKLLGRFNEKIVLPLDVAVDDSGRKSIAVEKLPSELMIKDIGDRTIEMFSEKIHEAKIVIWNGPLGVYEENDFMKGTKQLVEAIVESKVYSVIGGGDTEAAAERAGFSTESFSHVSLAGKAFLQYVSGMPLPGLEALTKD